MPDKPRRHPELARLYGAVGMAVLVFLGFRVYGILSKQVNADVDPLSKWTIYGFGLLNALFITVLAFIVGRSLAKLWFERRRGLLGSRIRTRLVLALLAVGIVPSVLIYVIGKRGISQNIERWFRPETQRILQDGRALAGGVRSETRRHLLGALAQVDGTAGVERARVKAGLDLLQLSPKGRPSIGSGLDLPPLRAGTHELPGGVWILEQRADGLLGGVRLDPVLSASLLRLERREREARALEQDREGFQSPAENMLLLLTLLSIFAAVWTGLAISKTISEPVQELADAAHRIGHGYLDVSVSEEGKDELSLLGRAFNRMAQDLKTSRAAIQDQADRIERQRAYLGQLLEALPVGVLSWDGDGALRTFNPAARAWFGCAPESQPEWDQLSQEPRTGSLPALVEAVRRDRRWQQEELRIGGEGEGRPVRAVVLPLAGGGALAVLEDLSALAQAEKRAAWQEVARRMAHEVKNPLTPIKLTAQRLLRRSKDGRLDSSTLAEAAETILIEVSALQRLVDSFSQFAKLPAPTFRELDAVELLRQVEALYVPSHPGIAWTLVLPDAPLPAFWDGDAVKRCVLNLVDNALGATGGKGAIRIALAAEGQEARLTVENDGPGVPVEIRERLFEPYFSTKHKGTGLGLAIVRRIAHDHGGEARYEPLAEGSRFEVKLPLRLG